METINIPSEAKMQYDLDIIRYRLTELDIDSQGEFDLTPSQQREYKALEKAELALLDVLESLRELNN